MVGEIVTDISENSAAALAAYKDLYRASERLPLTEGLEYEAETSYLIVDGLPRSASPAPSLSRAGHPAAVNDHGDTRDDPIAVRRVSVSP